MRKLRLRLEFWAFLAAAWIFASLPLETASGLSGWGWRRIAPLTSRHRRAVAQLRRAFPEKPLGECDAIARDMWECLGRTFAEFFHLRELRDSGRVIVENPRELLDRPSPERGFVACAAHQGNWEVAVLGLPRRAPEAAGLYQRIKNPLVDEWVRARRAEFYPGGLLEKSASTGLALMRHARCGGGVAIMSDLRDNLGVSVPFFGSPAPSTPFPALLARALGIPLYAATIVREPGARFRLRLDPVDVPRTGDKQADIEQATANLAAAFEASIRRRPEQWMWAHRRWG